MQSATSAESASTCHRSGSGWPAVADPPVTTSTQSAMLAAKDSDSPATPAQPTRCVCRRTRIERHDARSGGPRSNDRVSISMAMVSVPKMLQLLDVDRVERLVNVVHEDLHPQEPHQRVEEHADLDQQRHAVGADHGEQGDRVLEHEKADHLRNRLPAAHDDEQIG